jgi:hypothetical protein|tara:strand:- start:1239 stop:1682 length:444 start_codon:yes stop_codon:yes gene_type:complete
MKSCKNLLIAAILGLLGVSCGGSTVPHQSNSKTELIVQYQGEEVYRRGGKYIGEPDLRRILNSGEQAIVVFSAEWCNSCGILRRAVNQGNLKIAVHWINMDDPWAKKLAAGLGINTVPLMLHLDNLGGNHTVREGAGPIITYLLSRF